MGAPTNSASFIWRRLVKVKIWFCSNLCSEVRNGDKTCIVLDSINGLTSGHSLPAPLVSHLNELGLFTLENIGGIRNSLLSQITWPHSTNLRLRRCFEA